MNTARRLTLAVAVLAMSALGVVAAPQAAQAYTLQPFSTGCLAIDANGVKQTAAGLRLEGDWEVSNDGRTVTLDQAVIEVDSGGRSWTITASHWYDSVTGATAHGYTGVIDVGHQTSFWNPNTWYPTSHYPEWDVSGYATTRPGLKLWGCGRAWGE